MFHQFFLSRQPVLDHRYDVVGYELSCQQEGQNGLVEAQVNDKRVTAFLLDMGVEKIAGSKQVFLKVNAPFIQQAFAELLPAEYVSLIVPAAVSRQCPAEYADALDAQGYSLVLDLQDGEAPDEHWQTRAKYIRLHIDQLQLITQLRSRMGNMIVCGVEDYDSYHSLSALRIGYFQGGFFSKPDLTVEHPIGPSRLSVLHAMQQVVQAESLEDIEAVLLQDVDLSYRMFRLINSAAFGFQREIDSVRQAVALLGKKRIQLWLMALSFSALNDNKPSELMHIALVRGRMMELLAEYDGYEQTADVFLIGMFSLLDAMLDQPMETIVETMTLPDTVKRGLTDPHDRYARMVRAIQAMEKQNWTAVVDDFHALGLKITTVTAMYWDAVSWADEHALH